MLSINTNLSNLIAQNSMQTSTNKLNQAIERMTTGFKINHAKDNAANYSISTNMTTKIGAYQVAEENTAMGMDMVATASENLDQMQNHATRLRALATQARNGTYGAQSLEAIQSEANALTKEIERLYSTAEYNGVKLFDVVKKKTTDFEVPTVNSQGFIKDIDRIDVTGMKRLSEVENRTVDLTDGEYSICDLNDLLALVELANNGKLSAGDTFVMGADIDLGEYCDEQILNNNGGWTPIGDYSRATSKVFRGTFDGNGYTISNVKIDRATSDYQGLFGYADGTIKNLKVEKVDIVGQNNVGGLAGSIESIENCFVSGKILGNTHIGGLSGQARMGTKINNCSAEVNVNGVSCVGGVIGRVDQETNITNTFFIGNVCGESGSSYVGGFVGYLDKSVIKNCYSSGNVYATTENYVYTIGGLVGSMLRVSEITDSYSSCNVTGTGGVGGLVGTAEGQAHIKNCYSSGIITADKSIGGIVGVFAGLMENCTTYATLHKMNTTNLNFGGIVASVNGNAKIMNCSFEGDGEFSQVRYSGLLVGALSAHMIQSFEMLGCQVVSNVGKVGGVLIGSANANTAINVDISNCTYNSYYADNATPLFKTTNANVTFNLNNIVSTDYKNKINLQVGINSDHTGYLNLSTSFMLRNFEKLRGIGKDLDTDYFSIIDEFLEQISEKQVQFGAMQNRLDSALDEISIQYENLVSSRSTIRDADMAEVSSQYIQQQILQEASATLLSTTKNIQYQNVLGLLQGLRG